MTKPTTQPSNPTGAILLTSSVIPTMPAPREFVGHFFATKNAKDEAEDAVERELAWREIPEHSDGFRHYRLRGRAPVRIWWATYPNRQQYFVVLEF